MVARSHQSQLCQEISDTVIDGSMSFFVTLFTISDDIIQHHHIVSWKWDVIKKCHLYKNAFHFLLLFQHAYSGNSQLTKINILVIKIMSTQNELLLGIPKMVNMRYTTKQAGSVWLKCEMVSYATSRIIKSYNIVIKINSLVHVLVVLNSREP